MLSCADLPFIPNALQLCQILGFLSGEGAGLPQHGFPHLLAPAGGTGLIHLQGLEQDILLGVHDAQEVFQALAVVVGRVHMDVQAAGTVDLCPRMPDLPHTLLELWQLRIGQFGRNHLHFILPVICLFVAMQCLSLCTDASVTHQFPLFVFCVFDDPCIINPTFVLWDRSEIICQRLRGLFTGDAGHLHLDAEILVLHPGHAAASFRKASSTARMRRPMASITVTVTLLPACL